MRFGAWVRGWFAPVRRARGTWQAAALRRRRNLGERLIKGRRLLLEWLEPRRLLSRNPIINEVDPANKTGIVDQSGAIRNWLEVYNPDPQAAANLTNWSINYAKTNATWDFPSGTIIGPGKYRLVFCDSTPTSDPLGELHSNFGLSKNGSTLELLNATNTVVSSLTYPALGADTSYGPGETVTETDLVAPGATAMYYAPTNGTLVTTGTGSQQLDAADVQRLVLVLRRHRAGLRRKRQRIGQHRLPGEHRRHQPHHRQHGPVALPEILHTELR